MSAPTLPLRSRSRVRHLVLAAATITSALSLADVAQAQRPYVPPATEQVRLSGPRVGVTYLGGSITDSLAHYGVDVAPVITQFGWHFERIFYGGGNTPAVVSEWVLLVGGLEQSTFLPSLSWLVGMRTPKGTEFGVGPNLGPSGFALAFAGGVTHQAGSMNIPLNLAIVPSKAGVRVSMLVGVSMRRPGE